MKLNENRRKVLAFWVLSLALFLNPLGYDALFYMVLKATGDSYGLTTAIFYLLSVALFMLYFYLANIKIIQWIKERYTKVKGWFKRG